MAVGVCCQTVIQALKRAQNEMGARNHCLTPLAPGDWQKGKTENPGQGSLPSLSQGGERSIYILLNSRKGYCKQNHYLDLISRN